MTMEVKEIALRMKEAAKKWPWWKLLFLWIFDRETYSHAKNERLYSELFGWESPDTCQYCLIKERNSLRDKNRCLALLEKGIRAVDALIRESHGVAGLHLNGDVAPWDSLLEGGNFEEWLRDYSEALRALEEKEEGK